MIEPFTEKQISEKSISYGLSSYGYDIQLASEFNLFRKDDQAVIDPLKFNERILDEIESDSIIIPPNSFALGRSVEYMKIPNDVICICVGKSTYARCGIIINVTPLEPGWKGHITIEISNTTALPAKIYANMGIAQILFFKSDEPCEISYSDRAGKYQGQTGITLPKVK
jgi:dCTP deaminase